MGGWRDETMALEPLSDMAVAGAPFWAGVRLSGILIEVTSISNEQGA